MTNLQTIDLDTLASVHGGTPHAQPAQPRSHNNDVTADVDMSIGGQGGRGPLQVGGQARLHVQTRTPAYLRCIQDHLPLVRERIVTSADARATCLPLANR